LAATKGVPDFFLMAVWNLTWSRSESEEYVGKGATRNRAARMIILWIVSRSFWNEPSENSGLC